MGIKNQMMLQQIRREDYISPEWFMVINGKKKKKIFVVSFCKWVPVMQSSIIINAIH